ncbi:MAG: TROVE domain-containing protein [Deinococcales bacterium]
MRCQKLHSAEGGLRCKNSSNSFAQAIKTPPVKTPQNLPIDSKQIANNAGGYVWELSPWQRLDRFLVLGTEGGSFYVSERQLTIEQAGHVVKLLSEDPTRVIERTVEISQAGRAYKNDPALFILALAFVQGGEAAKAAEIALPKVARTGTHLFNFISYVTSMRGWGRSLKRAVANWYQAKDLSDLSYQISKYQSRESWSHRDLLRLTHPKANNGPRDALYQYIVSKEDKFTKANKLAHVQETWADYLRLIQNLPQASQSEVIEGIKTHRLPREVIPTEMLTDASVWEALLEKMPMTAMIRNLATMTRVGLLAPNSPAANLISERLSDKERLKAARIHPIAILAALMTYQAGQGLEVAILGHLCKRLSMPSIKPFTSALILSNLAINVSC